MRFVLIVFAFVASLVFISCELEEPAPIVGAAGRGLTVEPVVMDGYSWAQTVSGTISVKLPTSLVTSDVVGYVLAFDTTIVTSFLPAGNAVSLNLSNVPAGEHEIFFFVFTVRPFEGMLSIVGAPSRSYYTVITVETPTLPPPPPPPLTPPSAPTGVAVVWNDHPQVTWNATADTNFVSYTVRRHDNITGTLTEVGTITDRTITAFIDSLQPDLIGGGVAYSVGMSNPAHTTFGSPVAVSHGSLFPVTSVDAMLQRPGSSQAFVLSEGRTRLSVVSTVTNDLLSSVVTDSWPDVMGDWGFSADGSTLYLYTGSHATGGYDTVLTVYAHSSATLAKLRQFRIPTAIDQDPRLGVGSGSRLYVVDATPRILVIDGATGTVLSSSVVVPAFRARLVGVSEDRASLYVAGATGIGPPFELIRYDISATTPVWSAAVTTNNYAAYARTTVSGSELFVAVDGSPMEVVHPLTLAPIRTFGSPEVTNGFNTQTPFSLSATHLYIGYWKNPTEMGMGQYSLAEGNWKRWWRSARQAVAICAPNTGEYLYAAGTDADVSKSWMISLTAP